GGHIGDGAPFRSAVAASEYHRNPRPKRPWSAKRRAKMTTPELILLASAWRKCHGLKLITGIATGEQIFAEIGHDGDIQRGRRGRQMSNLQAFWIGVMVAWSPTLIVLAWLLRRSPHVAGRRRTDRSHEAREDGGRLTDTSTV